ncbi:MAG: ABC transporter ATP-binding protein [Alphaproteobacteria bacterium]|nr:ABC transporter ATP-binding protein [Alphaproteobacteria bacterium]
MKDAIVTSEAGLVLDEVGHAYDGRMVVEEVSLAVAPGELVCLLGPSGCGKTTTLRIAAGLEYPLAGSVRLDGRVVADGRTNIPPESRGVGFLFQDFALFPHLDVSGNVAFGIEGLPAAARAHRVAAMLELVGMAAYARSWPHMLSGGQQQRVALARALAPSPKLMLLDEPFSGLDSRLRDQVRDETLHVLKSTGVSTMMVTHDPEEAMFMADRIALMRDGRVVQMGPPAELYCRPADAFVAAFFGEVNRIPGLVEAGALASPFGPIPAPGLADGAPAEILIRPEALHLVPLAGNETAPCQAQVIAARMLGRTSLIHLRVERAEGALHLHSRMPGRFLPSEGEILELRLDRALAFCFPTTHPN